ncbi:YciI family protein [Larkinella soli]|nr:YciI family protein [Larkinella soli]
MAGYVLCKADSVEKVIGWSETCPILKYENGSVEIREIMSFAA